MSWLSENYEKAALSVAALVVVGVGYTVLSGKSKNPDPTTITPKNYVEIPESETLSKAVETYSSDYGFVSKKLNGNEVESFVAYPLYSIRGQEEITPLSDEYEIHPGMPIKWWKQYNLQDYTQQDGPERDPDGDGFTNREEMVEGTDPTLAEDRPDYLTKLVCDEIDSSEYEFRWTKAGIAGKGNFLFKYNGTPYRYSNLEIGSTLPDKKIRKPNFIERFEIIGKKQDPAKAGEVGEYFEIKDKLKDVDNIFKVYYRDRPIFNDWKAKMSVKINVAGVNKQFSLAEGDSFSLPFDPDAKEKPYKFLYLKDEKFLLFEHNVKGLPSPLELPIPNKSTKK